MNNIQTTINDLNNELLNLKKKHAHEIELIEQKINSIRQNCPHNSTSYNPDPSGNNDSYYECDTCGKTQKRQFNKHPTNK